jgi:hypothetical protein
MVHWTISFAHANRSSPFDKLRVRINGKYPHAELVEA